MYEYLDTMRACKLRRLHIRVYLDKLVQKRNLEKDQPITRLVGKRNSDESWSEDRPLNLIRASENKH